MAVRDGRWVPTFPKAKYIFHKGEYAAWEESTKRGETRAGGGGNVFRYNCQPIVEAGQALLVGDGYQLDDTFWLVPTPGHSPHHCCVISRRCRDACDHENLVDATCPLLLQPSVKL